MKTFWALSHPASEAQTAPEVVVGQDRFRLLAAIAPFIWALWHKQWRWSVFLLLISLVLGGLSAVSGSLLIMVNAAGLAVNIWYGFEAEALRQADYLRLGYHDLGSVWAVDTEHAYTIALQRAMEQTPNGAPH